MHFIERCMVHKHILTQCRCPDPNKSVRFVPCRMGCPQFKADALLAELERTDGE